MLELIFGTYFAVWWLVFKKFKLLPINLWTSVTSVFVVLVTIFVGFLWIGRYKPMSSQARTYAITTPVIAEVKGKVNEVLVAPNTKLEKGSLLFRIDPTQYEAKVRSVKAELSLAEVVFAQEETLMKQKAGNQADFDRAKTDVERLKANLAIANYELDATAVKAPGDGYVTQLVIRPGQFVTPMAFNQVMVFIHDEGPYLVGAFSQAEVEFIKPGDAAEFAFDLKPGRVYGGKVKGIQPLLSGGVIKASGALANFDALRKREMVPVLFELGQEARDLKLPVGVGATIGVYTEGNEALGLARKIILRIKSWENWLVF